MTEHPLLVQEYRNLLRRAHREDLLETTEPRDFERAIRQLLAEARQSEERDGSGLGFLHGRTDDDVVAVARERLGSRRDLAFPLEMIYRETLKSSDEYGWTVPFPVMFGEFPTGDFNAQAVRYKHGALLLINTGLMMLLHQCAGLIAQSFAVRVTADDSDETHAHVGQQLTHEELIRSLTAAVLAYHATGTSTNAPRASLDMGVHRVLATLICGSAESFVVGHELGHVVAGHLNNGRTVRRATAVPGLDLDVVPKSWEEEIEADIYGIRLLIPPSKRTITDIVAFQQFAFSLTGPYLFLGLDDLLNNIHLRVEPGKRGRDSLLPSPLCHANGSDHHVLGGYGCQRSSHGDPSVCPKLVLRCRGRGL